MVTANLFMVSAIIILWIFPCFVEKEKSIKITISYVNETSVMSFLAHLNYCNHALHVFCHWYQCH